VAGFTPTQTSFLQNAEALWIEAANAVNLPQLAVLAPQEAAISAAETSFGTNPLVTSGQANATGDIGLWQINLPSHPQYNANQLATNPLYNAEAAVQIENQQGLGAWYTWTTPQGQPGPAQSIFAKLQGSNVATTGESGVTLGNTSNSGSVPTSIWGWLTAATEGDAIPGTPIANPTLPAAQQNFMQQSQAIANAPAAVASTVASGVSTVASAVAGSWISDIAWVGAGILIVIVGIALIMSDR
jgi:hypothetical protein